MHERRIEKTATPARHWEGAAPPRDGAHDAQAREAFLPTFAASAHTTQNISRTHLNLLADFAKYASASF